MTSKLNILHIGRIAQISTALYRAYLQRLLPLLPAMREQIAYWPMAPPDLLEVSSGVLRDLMIGYLSDAPEWMEPVTNNERRVSVNGF